MSGDRFSVVGSTEEVLENCDEHTKIVDLQGKTVLPGLIDAHLHITNTGAMKLNLNLVSKQKQEILDMVADAYSSAKKKENGSLDGDGSMIRGMIHHFLPKKTWMLWLRIHRYTLQEPADMLHGRIQRHLKQQGSQRIHQTRQGENFCISRMEASLVWLLIGAQDPFNKAIPSYTKEQIQKIVLLAQQEFFSNGLTSVQDAGSPEEWVEAWQELYEKERLKLGIM